MSAVSWELLTTVVATVAPLNIKTEEATKWPPVAVRVKLGGSVEKVIVAGEIDARLGDGRALPHSGFSALHPGKSRSMTRHEPRRTIRQEDGMGSV